MISNYQLDRVSLLDVSESLIKATDNDQIKSGYYLSAGTKVSPIMENYNNSKLGQTSESREVTGTAEDYSYQGTMACPSFSSW